jgi:hypothetical protein
MECYCCLGGLLAYSFLTCCSSYGEMICRGCTELHPFLSAYRGLAVTPVRQAADIASDQLLDVCNNDTETPKEPQVKFSNVETF